MGVGHGAVLEPRDLRITGAEVSHQLIARDRQCDANGDVPLLEAVVVAVILALVHAVGQFGHRRAHAPVGVVEDAVEVAQVGLDTKLLGERDHPLGADLRRPQHRPQVAIQEFRRARIDEQQFPDVVAHLAFIHQFEHRKSNPLVPDLRRFRVVGTGQAPADVGLVGAVAAEARDHRLVVIAVYEDRPSDHPIRQVIAARHVGIGEHEDITRLETAPEPAEQRPYREAASAGVDRDSVGVGDQRPVGRGDEATEVVRLAEDRAAGGPRHHPTHMPCDLVQAVLHQRQHDRIEALRLGSLATTCVHGALGRGYFDEEPAVVTDRQRVVRPDQDGRRERLDQGGARDLVPWAKRSRVVDGRLLPAMAALPRRTDLDGLHRCADVHLRIAAGYKVLCRTGDPRTFGRRR